MAPGTERVRGAYRVVKTLYRLSRGESRGNDNVRRSRRMIAQNPKGTISPFPITTAHARRSGRSSKLEINKPSLGAYLEVGALAWRKVDGLFISNFELRPDLRACAVVIGKGLIHTPDTLGTLPDIAANARPLRAWLKCRTITTHARERVADLSRNCKGFRARESVHACVTESRAQGTGVGRDIRQSPSRVRSIINLWYNNSPPCVTANMAAATQR